MRVWVPFRNRQVTGYILEQSRGPALEQPLKEILDILDPTPLFHANMVPFFEWISEYYLYPIGQVIKFALPKGLNKDAWKTAVVTDAGRKAMERKAADPSEMECLLRFKNHPGAYLPRNLRTVLVLQSKGWLRIGERSARRSTNPLVRMFVRPASGGLSKCFLAREVPYLRARNEETFLKRVLAFEKGVLQSELCREFPNAGYLIDKWVRKGIVERFASPVYRNPAGELLVHRPRPRALLQQQAAALDCLRESIGKRRFSAYLLHGVTGSGKTEVYIRAIEETLKAGRQCILMVPEISLATYMHGLLRARLGDRTAIYHSSLSQGERYDEWVRMARGEVDLVVGARSALWAPLPDPGLIIVDEEHDTAYKQENPPRYQARDAAVVRARMAKALIVLGSGTPSIQSFHNALNGRYQLLLMPQRVEQRPLPDIEMVDMKAMAETGHGGKILSPRLKEAMAHDLTAGNQVILFLNRRGFHRLFICMTCGKSVSCPNCDVALIHHRDNRLRCHYCGFDVEAHGMCPSCSSKRLKPYGFGTERLETELDHLFPGVRVARMDTDSTRRKGSAFDMLKRFSEGRLDVLLGTQMITKGYDFPNVTLVGVIAADLSLGFPDFRAGERTFQILSQVAGRAGRGKRRGRVIVQTFNMDHYAIQTAMAHDYHSFFEQERSLREALGYPPFGHLTCLRIKGNNKEKAAEAADFLGKGMRKILQRWPKWGQEIRILGPAEAPIPRIKGKYRWQILVKGQRMALIKHLVASVEDLSRGTLQSQGMQLIVDVDPYQMT